MSFLDRPTGENTGSVTEQLRLLYDAWRGIFNPYDKDKAPACGPFWGRYKAYVRKGRMMQMAKISPQKLYDNLQATPDIEACGLDAWSVAELKKLPFWWWERLADTLNLIEQGAPWPHPLRTGYLSFIRAREPRPLISVSSLS